MRLPSANRILVYGRPVDMRKGFTGLQATIRSALREDPLSGDLFVFMNARGNLVKILLWDRTGFVIVAKKLEKGRFKLRQQAEKFVVTPRSLELLMDGLPVGGEPQD